MGLKAKLECLCNVVAREKKAFKSFLLCFRVNKNVFVVNFFSGT